MPEPSIYHRLESPTQTSEDAQRQEKSREKRRIEKRNRFFRFLKQQPTIIWSYFDEDWELVFIIFVSH